MCRCFRRSPPFPGDAQKQPKSSFVESRLDEFIKYVGVLRDLETSYKEESYLLYPRFFVGDWCPFATDVTAKKLWEDDLHSGRQLWAPTGLKDMTHRWVKLFCRAMNTDWKEALACFDRVQLGPAGAVMRPHVENGRAHAWHAQIQGRRAYVLFPPEEGSKLYAGEGTAEQRDLDERSLEPRGCSSA